ncbi:Tumor necrosis factor alpha-induced protein 8 protein 2 [Fasciolopsis buskii]|uniref:Tumor necrosis factor alpha-induced protein 8 protein 2 n=1 Tax=Fasciolopsis buskii TaxID=27845 RepID=A0A8E0S052_9TREM|nr:Tumor necrosis factor alpha-induced protein 8 protein 2 [Fasciolopsis buski]
MASKPTESDTSQDEDECTEPFSVKSITFHLQRKLLNNLPNGLIRLFLDNSSVRLFDSICALLKLYTGCAKTASQTTKRLFKMNVRLAVYSTTDMLSEDEQNMIYDFHDRCHQAAEIVLRLGRPRRRLMPGVSPTLDKLIQTVDEAKSLALAITERHVGENTREKFRTCVEELNNMDFFSTIFGQDERYKELMEKVYDDVEDLMDRGLF